MAETRRGLFGPVLHAGAVPALVGDGAWLAAMLTAEVALVGALADSGLAPSGHADLVAVAARSHRFDVDSLGDRGASSGNPVVPLVAELVEVVGGDAAASVHRGATSQDIIDSAAMMVTRDALDAITADARRAADAAAALAARHRDLPMAGRTLLQQAAPVTFGWKAACWMAGLDAARTRLETVRRDRLAAQLGGAVGTLAGYDGQGRRVLANFAARLGLADPGLPWHTERSRIGEVAGALAVLSGAVAKVAGDVVLLAQTEVAEVREGVAGRGGSSVMPHKRNPVAAIAARSAAAQAPGLAATLLASMGHEHERAAGPWHAEWTPLVALLTATGSAVFWLADCLASLEVDPVAMARNLERTGGLLVADRVAAALVPALGRRAAHRLVARAAGEVRPGRPLGAVLGASEEVRRALGDGGLEPLLDPRGATGEAVTLVDEALGRRPA